MLHMCMIVVFPTVVTISNDDTSCLRLTLGSLLHPMECCFSLPASFYLLRDPGKSDFVASATNRY
jgi:hypothetical protein